MRRPSFAELLGRADGRPVGTAWGVYGDNDRLGTVNELTPDRLLAALTDVRLGEVHSLNWRVDRPTFSPFRPKPERVHLMAGGDFGRDDYLDQFYLQYSSQWDGLRHITRPDGFYNGVPASSVDDPDSDVLGIQSWAERGLAGRGVLLDVARHRAESGQPIDPRTRFVIDTSLLEATAAAEGVEVRPGDVVLVRTGWAGWYEALPAAERESAVGVSEPQPGLDPGEDMAAWLWDHGVAAVAADNTSLEAWPMAFGDGSLHRRLIPGLGMPIGEHFWLDGLADACGRDRRWSFLFVSAPLNVAGGVGSPPNALAIR